MKRITPFLWFEKDIQAITDYYSSIFPNITSSDEHEINNTPSGSVQTKTIYIYGVRFDLMTAGPYLPYNPTVSFIINTESVNEAEKLWNKITLEGKILMPLGTYDFAAIYGWAQDKYGVSWQVMFRTGEQSQQKITSTLMFCGDVCGRAEEAMNFYVNIFKNSHTDYCEKYDGTEPFNDIRAKTKHAGFTLDGSAFSVLDSGMISPLTFDQSVSFVVNCADQAEVDYYYSELIKDGGKEVECGWVSDKFGVPWQVVPTRMLTMLSTGTPDQIKRVTESFMQMKKFDIQTLENAFEGK